KKQWQGGGCVTVNATPGSMEVDKGAQVAITATAHHVIDDVDLNLPIIGKFQGVRSLSPQGSPVTGPGASFTFTAGTNMGDTGTVTLTSTSKRGIGTASLTYKVKDQAWWAGTLSWTLSGSQNDTLLNGRYSSEAMGSGNIVLDSGGFGVLVYKS